MRVHLRTIASAALALGLGVGLLISTAPSGGLPGGSGGRPDAGGPVLVSPHVPSTGAGPIGGPSCPSSAVESSACAPRIGGAPPPL
jgi:hypothetical protein